MTAVTVILDDDPTGIQTVRDCPLLTQWDRETLRAPLERGEPYFFILTNLRALEATRARGLLREVVANVLEAAETAGVLARFIARSDSTLRSHFPLELETIADARGTALSSARVFLIPAFFEGGRVTAGDVHYVVDGGRRVPAGETEFARDPDFGYRSSDLKEYIREKMGKSQAVGSLSLDRLRSETPAELRETVRAVQPGTVTVVNSEEYADLDRFTRAAKELLNEGEDLLFHSAASFVRSYAGLSEADVSVDLLPSEKGGGIIVVGSFVEKSSRQLRRLLEEAQVDGIEVPVGELPERGESLVREVGAAVERSMKARRTAVVYTSRDLANRRDNLALGRQISDALVAVVENLAVSPAYIVAKGGITSHVLLTEAARVREGRVLGSIIPGVPALRTPEGSRFPGIPFIIFPGNVGDDNALANVFRRLNGER